MTVAERKSEKYEKQRKENSKLVKGIFRFHEVPGGTMKFVFKEFPGDQIQRYIMNDGETYEVPLGVAKHLNKDCWYPQHQHIMDAKGQPMVTEEKKVRRCSFQSLEFVDFND